MDEKNCKFIFIISYINIIDYIYVGLGLHFIEWLIKSQKEKIIVKLV